MSDALEAATIARYDYIARSGPLADDDEPDRNLPGDNMTVKPTQRQNVARRLLDAPLCGATRDPLLGIRIAARINELRNVGYVVETRPCEAPRHKHQTKHIEYYLPHRNLARYRCALCGGTLRSSGEGVQYYVDWLLLIFTCDRCGRKDLR